jgi:CotH kinase protein/Lamin Tail Domain/Secretion system C-terminal sorting domain/Fn3 associated/Divergent InlB B-repeat domain
MPIRILQSNLCILVIILLVIPISAFSQNLYINEIMSLNSSTITDEDGDFSDWIEIYNGSPSTINLEGYFISDDPDIPVKWSFPNATVEADSFLLIFASDKDRNYWPNELHTNFRLSANGESLILSDPDTLVVDYVEFPPSTEDISFGRVGNGVDEWALFEVPTPRTDNNTTPTPLLQASPPLLSLESGSYPVGTLLELSSIEGEIYITSDGSIPDENSIEYESGLLLESVTVIRAICLVPNKAVSEIVNATYIVDFESELAIVSLITDPPNLWDWETGIYVLGPNADEEWPHEGANFYQDWEKPVYFEFFSENGNFEFSQNLGLKIHGGTTRIYQQKSLRLYARDEYGISNISEQIFPDKPIYQYKRFLLRNSGSDWKETLFRDAMITSLMKGTEVNCQAYKPTVVFINGEYWGIHNFRERIDKFYIESNYNVNPESIDLIFGEGRWAVEGDVNFYQSMVDYSLDNDITETSVFDSVASMMSIENNIQYYSAEIFIGNYDWPGNNNKCWRSTDPPSKFEWLLYDTDWGLGHYISVAFNTLHYASSDTMISWANPPERTRLFRRLLTNEGYRNSFIVSLCDMASIVFEEQRVLNRIEDFSERIEPEIDRHFAKWNPDRDWETSINEMRTFINRRKLYVIQHLRDKFDLGDEVELIISNIDSTEGRIRVNEFWLESENFSGIYFEDLPIRLIAEPTTGYRFTGWSGDIKSEKDTLNFVLEGETSIQPNFEPVSENLPIVVINEINYNSCESFNPGDWIELYAFNQDVDLTGWTLSDGNDTTAYTFPVGTTLLKDSLLVIARFPEMFSESFVSIPTPIGGLDFGLNSNGDQIILKDQDNNIIDVVEYQSSNPWPSQPNGNGPTLELINPLLPNQYSHNWSASLINYGTPKMSASDYPEPEQPDLPFEFKINKIYPNPFNTSTRIVISLPRSSDIKISLYNVLGQFVKEIHSGYISSGTYSFHMNGNDLSSGIYFVQASVSGKLNLVEKIILLK